MRAIYVICCITCALLLALHARQVDWARFAAAFALIDLVGYLPGWLATRLALERAPRRPISAVYHHLYNYTHSVRSLGLAAAAWAAALGRPEWAMLALPLHLAGDRGLLGNFAKPIGRPFDGARA